MYTGCAESGTAAQILSVCLHTTYPLEFHDMRWRSTRTRVQGEVVWLVV